MENKYTVHTIENDYLRITASEKGGELKSVYDKKAQRELLWQGDDRYWADSAPNLFPYIARLKEGKYTYQGKSYQMKIHGFVMYSVLTCTESEEGLCFELKSDENTRSEYPFDFVYRVKYQLDGSELNVAYEVENRDTKTMYFGIGGHPGFQVPFVNGTEFEDYYLEFAENAKPLKVKFSDDCFVLGKEEYHGLTEGKLSLKHSLFDEDAIVLENTGGHVVLKCRKSGTSISVRYEDMRYVGFWHCPRTEAPYVCIEPWSSLPSRKGVTEDLEKQEDLNSLLPGEIYKNTFRIALQMDV